MPHCYSFLIQFAGASHWLNCSHRRQAVTAINDGVDVVAYIHRVHCLRCCAPCNLTDSILFWRFMRKKDYQINVIHTIRRQLADWSITCTYNCWHLHFVCICGSFAISSGLNWETAIRFTLMNLELDKMNDNWTHAKFYLTLIIFLSGPYVNSVDVYIKEDYLNGTYKSCSQVRYMRMAFIPQRMHQTNCFDFRLLFHRLVY